VPQELHVPVLVLGGGTGGAGAALQCARSGVECLLATPGPWLGGMLSASGVSAPDGNELAAWQTGLWGALLRQLRRDLPEGLDHNWVSCFGFRPADAERVLQRWVEAEPRLDWRSGLVLRELEQRGSSFTAAILEGSDGLLRIRFEMLVDGSELGDALAVGGVSHRLGWEPKEHWQEPSAPPAADLLSNPFFQRQPVQSPTWVVLAQWRPGTLPMEGGPLAPPFATALERHPLDRLLAYGRLPGDLVMLNWPLDGNDWHEDPGAAFSADPARQQAQLRGLRSHSLGFLEALAAISDGGLVAADAFPGAPACLALQPYWRESRRLQGHVTVREQDLLPGQEPAEHLRTAVAVGNYPNDHHYPGPDWPLAGRSRPWGGRWSGAPFVIPFAALHGPSIDNLLMADKGISVSHMANGATRLGPLILNIGQAAGLAAALAVQRQQRPADLSVRLLQDQLIGDRRAPAAVVPLTELAWHDPAWLEQQRGALDGLGRRSDGKAPPAAPAEPGEEAISLELNLEAEGRWWGWDGQRRWPLITLEPSVRAALPRCHGRRVTVRGRPNPWGPWWRINGVEP
jgi:hypothetical protein